MRRLLLIVVVSAAAGAFAERKGQLRDFEPTEKTEAEREAARVKARYRIETWRETDPLPEEPKFPWMPLGITLLSFAVVAPFAWSAYRGTSKDLRSSNAFGTRRRKADDE
jgi:hypothetical protein